MEQKKKKRTGLVIALVACLALVGVAGVMAWYSSTSEIKNNFVDGGITEPGTDPTDPNKPLRPEVTPPIPSTTDIRARSTATSSRTSGSRTPR